MGTFIIFSVFFAMFLLYCMSRILYAFIVNLYAFVCRKVLERDCMKSLRKGKDVEICIYDYEKILGIPIMECLRQKKMKRNVDDYPYTEKITYVNPVLKLVDDKVILVGEVVHRKNKPKQRISAETYLHYYDPPKPDLYRFDAKQGKYILVSRKTSNQEPAV